MRQIADSWGAGRLRIDLISAFCAGLLEAVTYNKKQPCPVSGSGQRHDVLLHAEPERRRRDQREMRVAAAGRLADRADVDDAHVRDRAIERDVAAAANHDVPRLVAE